MASARLCLSAAPLGAAVAVCGTSVLELLIAASERWALPTT